MEDALTNELRELLRSGVSVARLVRCAKERRGDQATPQDLARAVWSAFGIGMGGWNILRSTESFGSGNIPDWHLTLCFLDRLMATRDEWDGSRSEPCWLDGLPTTPHAVFFEQATAERAGLTETGWNALSETDRNRACEAEATRRHLSERLYAVCALAEQLQRRVNELERELKSAELATTH